MFQENDFSIIGSQKYCWSIQIHDQINLFYVTSVLNIFVITNVIDGVTWAKSPDI